MLVFPMTNSKALGAKIAEAAGCKAMSIESERFPDGELHLRFMDEVNGRDVVLVQSMHPNPNDALLEMVLAGMTAKELGARNVTGIAPYLAYMRQDKRFHAGECVSNRVVAHMLSQSVDRIVTVDPHLHRVRSLAELFHIGHRKVSANNAIADYISLRFSAHDSVIAGPDIESSQWARSIAEKIGFGSAIFLKERFGSRHVKIRVTEELEWKGRNAVIIDDIISSGHTMIEAVKEIRKRKPKAVHCICVHGIFAEGAYEKLKKAGAKSIVSTNSIAHRSNAIDISGTIAKEL
ncbi:MAG: ribose-phosphate diphosphokinase [Candidatus Diapherotrites archaeon]|uniref:ribose-phosphate diphosphokinase n=1 Tax=Candidatus Iainarchaeum sp. TaxID=3101447 RepID=A0A8T3YIG6_9ARCH|nr:ribose-phosphate diphosphokinase [Candidatus Diapherotrites archaeon]